MAKIKAITEDIFNYMQGQPLLLVSRHADVALVVSDAYFRRFALADESWYVKPCWTDVVVVKEGKILQN
ncbi:hypothetical protein APY03_0281 [Variovorax sp. WDL1]|nr:hypothetical protein APY03_0281 [Variovorax sp. WDL1]